MKNKSLKNIWTLICFCTLTLYSAQCKKINFLIMIDEQPCVLAYDVEINSTSMSSIEAKYTVGTIDFSDENYNRFINDKSQNFELSFRTFLPKSSLPNKYIISIPKNFLNQEFIIIDIFNKGNKLYKKRYSGVNKNSKKEYYVVMSTRNAMKFD